MNIFSPRGANWRWCLAPVSACIAFAVLTAHGSAQTNWTLRAAPSVPPARLDAAIAFDGLRGRTVLFGGGTGVGDLSDTWEWDGTNWTPHFPVNNPPARESGRLVFDSGRGVLVLFGGYSTPVGAVNDTWEWNGTNWTQRLPSSSPAPRYYHAMAFDAARGETVLCGGYGGGYLGDTWVWNGTSWTQRAPAASPGARTQMAMAYDASRQRIVAFGGRTSPTNYPGGTWEWDGTNWSLASPASAPAVRESHAMTFDALRARVVLFGGNDPGNVRQNDTWEYDGSNWHQRTPVLAPAPVRYHAMAYDPLRARTVLFGGSSSAGVLNQTWEYHHPAPATYVTFGSGCAGTSGTPNLAAASGQLPWLGSSFRVDLTNARPVTFAALVWGFSNTTTGVFPLPHHLDYLGAPGCHLFVAPTFSQFLFTDLAGNGSVTRGLPNDPAFLGLHIYDQFAVFDTAANALGLVVSQSGDACLAAK